MIVEENLSRELLKYPYLVVKPFAHANNKTMVCGVFIAPENDLQAHDLKLVFGDQELLPIHENDYAKTTYFNAIDAAFPMKKQYFEGVVDFNFLERGGSTESFKIQIQSTDDLYTGRPEYHWLSKNLLPFPDPEHIFRVAGKVGMPSFLLEGSTWFKKLDNICINELGRSVLDVDVLDWGVGCARILRHLVEHGSTKIVGCDIDPVNIQWVKENIWQNVWHSHYDPPLPFEDNSFDVIYGHSIFTHLSYEDQFRWLEEINRILRPGGIALVTICGETGVYITKHKQIIGNSAEIRRYLDEGFLDFGAVSVGVDEGRPGYYRLIAHTHAFIRNHWVDYVNVKAIYPCFAQHQDAILLTKQQ